MLRGLFALEISPVTHYDVFNGDADGICALQQLRLAEAREGVLVTGVKRDIALLKRVAAEAGDRITVLDVSLDKNREPLGALLDKGVSVRWFDHHFPGDIPRHEHFEPHIETIPDKGTSLLVDEHLGGRFRAWALVGTFGDNFDKRANALADEMGIGADDVARLRELGICLNYNGYGARIEDLHFAPDALFERLHPYGDPLAFINDDDTFAALRQGYADDMAKARGVAPELLDDGHGIYILPAQAWARRASGVYANELASGAPERAHAMLTELPGGGYVVSVRAPLARPEGADALCRQFPTGGGRKAAAGINELPAEQLQGFIDAFKAAF